MLGGISGVVGRRRCTPTLVAILTSQVANLERPWKLPMFFLGGVSVLVNGVPAPIFFARSDQVNVQIPYEVSGQAEALITLTYNRGTSIRACAPTLPTTAGAVTTARSPSSIPHSIPRPGC